jgi:ABC-type multidrug transport system ATPase subunit
MQRGTILIDVQGLTVRFGRSTAVDDVSFDVPVGESLALWGANGAGKTTVILALLGLVQFSGSALIAGYDVKRHGRNARRLVGYVPQRPAIYQDMQTLAYLSWLAQLRRAPASQAVTLLEQVGLAAHAGKAVGKLSGGMLQRLALAGALLADPPILLLDEPTANLDSAGRSEFLSLLSGLRAGGKTLLFTSHRAEEVAMLADNVLVLADGRTAGRSLGHEFASDLQQQPMIQLQVALEKVEEEPWSAR